MKPNRILQIVTNLSAGSGVLAVVLNWHKHIDTTRVQFDYLYMLQVSTNRQQEIEQLGGYCYQMPDPRRHPLRFLRESYRFFKMHRYQTVHSHITHLNFFFYPIAKLFGTKNRIQHAHLTTWSDKKLSGLRNYLMLHSVWPLITHKMACSQAAGTAYYGKNFTVVNNGIDVGKFDYNPAVRNAKRKELGLENNFVIGHVGRFVRQKNHTFLIDIFEQIIKQEPAAKLVLVGNGSLETHIQKIVAEKHLQNSVLFLGSRKDVAELYQVFDVFCMPSLQEGLPVVGVEAQASGLPCLFADTITPEVLLLPNSSMLSLEDSPVKWAQQILTLKGQPRTSGKEALRAKGFDIRQTAKQIQGFYEELAKNLCF